MIQVQDLHKKFRRFEALRGLSFSVPQGSAFALIGANGAGKTTIIKILTNILEPTSGRAILLGELRIRRGLVVFPIILPILRVH